MPTRTVSSFFSAVLFVALVCCGPGRRPEPEFRDDFSDGDSAGWSFDNSAGWEVVDGVLYQKSQGDSTGDWFRYFARLDAARADSDFTLTVSAGFNPKAYPMRGPSQIQWKIYYRCMAFGIMQDSRNGLLATFQRTNGRGNGIVRIDDGAVTYLCQPYSGQGYGLEIHDLRRLEMCRKGNVITVYADGRVVYQAQDVTDGPPLSGSAVVCGQGPVGLALDELSLGLSAPKPPDWPGPEQVTDFMFDLDEGAGHLIADRSGKCRGTVELGPAPQGNLFGWWVDESASPGRKSYAAAGGQLTIRNYTMGPKATLECWFKLLGDCRGGGVPIMQLLFDGTLVNPSWTKRERGGPMAVLFPDSTVGLHFHEFGDIMGDIPGVFTPGQWSHLAWVRDGVEHRIYVDRREVFTTQMTKYGETVLPRLQINLAQNADHDWLTRLGSAYVYLDNIRATSRALQPEEFLEK